MRDIEARKALATSIESFLFGKIDNWQDISNKPQHGWRANWRRFWETRISRPLFNRNPYWPFQDKNAWEMLRAS